MINSRMIRMAVIVVALPALTCEWASAVDKKLDKLRYPLTKSNSIPLPHFELEITDAVDPVDARKWGESAVELCEEWFPVLCKFLDTENYSPPEVIRIVIKKDLNVPGATSGSTISVNEEWIHQHPDDFGMMIHELIHVIQNYPDSRHKPGWIVEGIADYLRYWKYESERPRQHIGLNDHYQDGYGTSASFLAWIVWKYDRRIVRRLDSALRKGEYDEAIFNEITGKNLPELWDEFITQEQKQAK